MPTYHVSSNFYLNFFKHSHKQRLYLTFGQKCNLKFKKNSYVFLFISEPPISTPNCPRLYGIYSNKDNCRIFYSCWNGEASKYECPPGLAYDAEQRVCVWADLVERCDQFGKRN